MIVKRNVVDAKAESGCQVCGVAFRLMSRGEDDENDDDDDDENDDDDDDDADDADDADDDCRFGRNSKMMH